jgi:hypothetical protein
MRLYIAFLFAVGPAVALGSILGPGIALPRGLVSLTFGVVALMIAERHHWERLAIFTLAVAGGGGLVWLGGDVLRHFEMGTPVPCTWAECAVRVAYLAGLSFVAWWWYRRAKSAGRL